MIVRKECVNPECVNRGKPSEEGSTHCEECRWALMDSPVVEATPDADTEEVVPEEQAPSSGPITEVIETKPAAKATVVPDQVPEVRRVPFWQLGDRPGKEPLPKVRMVEPNSGGQRMPVLVMVVEAPRAELAIQAQPPAPAEARKVEEQGVVLADELLEPVEPKSPTAQRLAALAADKPKAETVGQPPDRVLRRPVVAAPKAEPAPVVQASKLKPVEEPQTVRIPPARRGLPNWLLLSLVAAVAIFLGALAIWAWAEYRKDEAVAAEAKPVVEEVAHNAAPKTEAAPVLTAEDSDTRNMARKAIDGVDQLTTGMGKIDGRVRSLENREQQVVIGGSFVEAAVPQACQFDECVERLLREGDQRLLEAGLITHAEARESAKRTCRATNCAP